MRKWQFLLILLQQVTTRTGIAHDSLFCIITDEKGQQQRTSLACDRHSHHILKLVKRDDVLAKQIALENDMLIEGKHLFDIDIYYYTLIFNENNTDPDHIRRKRLEAIASRAEVVFLFEDRPVKRVKRLLEQPNSEFTRQTNIEQKQVPKLPFPDPLYQDQWYLVGMNVHEAWLMGYAGRNVSITILDDGIQRDHPDLVKNYDPFASTDLIDGDSDPTPLGDNKHGTRCAGEVAATAGNDVCGVGVAYLSKIGGVRMLHKNTLRSIEAAALNFNNTYIDIYSASWGPDDDDTGSTTQVVYEDGKNHRRLDLQQQSSHCSEDWEFPCKDGRNCIARYDQCDGIEQCPDGSDEENSQHRYERPNQNTFNVEQQQQRQNNHKAMNRPVGPSKHAGTNSQQQDQQQQKPPTAKEQSPERRLRMEFLLLGASAFVIVAAIVHVVVKLKRKGCMTGRGTAAAVRGFRKGESLIDDEDDLLISQAYT